MWPTAKYDLPRARQEASRPAATAAMITAPNPAFSRLLTRQISHAALWPQQAREGHVGDFVAALYALLGGTRRFGRPHWLRCELHAASHRLPRLTRTVAASYEKQAKSAIRIALFCLFCTG